MKTRNIPVFVISIILVLVSSGCALPFGQAPTPVPTDTPLPPPTATNTLEPTATFTPLPTDTPTATPDLKATQAALNEQAVKDALTILELPTDTGHLGWYQEEPIAVSVSGNSFDYQVLDDGYTAGDFVLYTEMTWKTDSWPTCGVMFRSDENYDKGNSYWLQFLRFSGLPAWRIIYASYKTNVVSIITNDIKFSSSLSIDDGATNDIVLVAQGNEFKVYVNGKFEGQYYDWSKKLSDGRFAFYATQSAGKTTCTYDKSWVWEFDK